MKIQSRINLIFAVLAGALAVMVLIQNRELGVVVLLATAVVLAYCLWLSSRSDEERKQDNKRLIEEIDTAAKHTVSNLPIPVVALNQLGQVKAYNKLFTDLFEDHDVLEKSIFDLLVDLNVGFATDGFHQEGLQLDERIYNVEASKVENTEDTILYLIDTTDYNRVKQVCNDRSPVVFHISVDNLDEVSRDIKEDYLPFIKSEIEKLVYRWGGEQKGLVKRLSSDKFIVISNRENLEQIEQQKFAILDNAREIDEGNKLPITFSIGVGHESEDMQSLEAEAFSCLEIALGRGGDQAVLRRGGNYEYFGGKTKAIERRNRVKARVIAHGMRSLIKESDKVFVMGHRFPDMDCFGACVGIFRAVKLLGGEPHIVMGPITMAIEAVYDTFKDKEEYSFISGEEAMDMATENSLLVVVDTHKASISEHPPLVDAVERVAVIDHHRRGAEFIDKAVVKYVEPYSSSASELVSEVLQYIVNKPELLPEEADALLAGITVDTKNFSLRTGVRTFDAASFLRAKSADPIKVRQLFQDDLEIFRSKAAIVSSAEKYAGNIAIATTEEESEHIQLVAAQAANDILDIKGILASFVIARSDAGITFVSGRSLGEFNVQLILEAIGGGGHLEVAGAQFEDKSVEEVKELLKAAIDEYLAKEEEQEEAKANKAKE